jgi:hypothetical protein
MEGRQKPSRLDNRSGQAVEPFLQLSVSLGRLTPPETLEGIEGLLNAHDQSGQAVMDVIGHQASLLLLDHQQPFHHAILYRPEICVDLSSPSPARREGWTARPCRGTRSLRGGSYY